MYKFVTEEKIKSISQALDKYKHEGNFSFSTQCEEFEEKLCEYEEYKYCVLTVNGSMANLLVAFALREYLGSEYCNNISFPALTWSTNIAPFRQAGFECDIYDISMEDLCIDGGFMANRNITCVTEVLGFMPNYNQFDNRTLIIDGCESFGSQMNIDDFIKRNIFALTRSFYMSHQFSTIEGGAVFTDNEVVYKILLSLREHGWTRRIREKSEDPIEEFENSFNFKVLGFNARPINMIGYLGCQQLDKFLENIDNRAYIYIDLLNVIADFPFCMTIHVPYYMKAFSPLAFPIIFKDKEIRNEVIKDFEGKIECRPLIAGNITKHEFLFGEVNIKDNLVNADYIHDCGMYIPLETDPEILRNILEKINE